MATFRVTAPNGQTYRVQGPDGATDAQAQEQVLALHPEAAGAAQAAPVPLKDRPNTDKIEQKNLQYDPDWLASSRIVYKTTTGKDFAGNNEALANYGMDEMGQFNYNTPTMAIRAAGLVNASPEQKKAYLYLMETYDKTSATWAGAGRFAFGAATDPMSYVGLSTLGIGTVAAGAGKAAAKEGLKDLLKAGIHTGIVAATEGSIMAGAQDSIRQTAEINAGGRTERDLGQTAGAVAMGAGAGLALGTVAGAAGRALFNHAGLKAAEEAAAAKAGSAATPNAELSAGIAPDALAGLAPENAAPKVNPTAGAAVESPRVDTAPVVPATLPQWLAGAKTNFQKFGLDFESDVEKALFITSQKSKSKADDAYREWLRSQGYADADIDRLGAEVRAHIKEQARVGEGDRLSIGQIAERNAAAEPTVAPKLDTAEAKPFDLTAANPEGLSAAQQIIKAVEDVSADSGARLFHTTKDGLNQAARQAVDLLNSLGIHTVDDATEVLRRTGFTTEQQQTLLNAVKQSTNELAAGLNKAIKEGTATPEMLAQLEHVQKVVTHLDTSLSSNTGRNLGDRGGSFNTGEMRNMSTPSHFDDAAKELGLTGDAAKEWARQQWSKVYDEAQANAAKAAEVRALETKQAQAVASGDIPTAVLASSERAAIVAAHVDEELAKAGVSEKVRNAFSKAQSMAIEWMISTVFTPATLVRNLVPSVLKTLYVPMRNAMVKGLDEAARRELAVSYKTMFNFSGSAFHAAKAAFKYEKALLTGDETKLLEFTPQIPGTFGRVVRGFNKAMAATDEFFSQIHYRGWIEGNATFDAVNQANKLGLTGKGKEEFIAKAVKEAVGNAYERELDSIGTIDFLREEGVRRGKTGDALSEFVKTELEKNGELFKKAAGETAMDYTRDFLFKREFSGESSISSLAKGYEQFVQRNPWMRLVGQLFFRTPVRVFEEGIRLTPGLNLISPGFVADLAGSNGAARQIRAQGEALMSYGIGSLAMTMYASGTITGGGPSDYKQRRALENTGWQPYSIKTKDGWYSFRSLDPIATPFKIILNAMDRYQMLQYREAQGEYVDQDLQRAAAFLGVGVGAVAQAIKDANLAEGISQATELLTDVADPEGRMDAIVKFVASKAKLVVPNVIQKGLGVDALMGDPATAEQYFKSIINPTDPTIPRQYDALGNAREKTTGIGAIFGYDYTSGEDAKRGHSDKELSVLKTLSDIEIATGNKFTAPYKYAKYTGQLDLRTEKTADGRMTLYDRWQEIYNKSNTTDVLYEVFKAGGSMGSSTNDGSLAKAAREIINTNREAAFIQMLSEEHNVEERYIRKEERSANDMLGGADQAIKPY